MVNKKITKLIFIVIMHIVLPKSQESTDAHLPSFPHYSMFLVLYIGLDISIGRLDIFPNFGIYQEFSFYLNGATMPPWDIRG
jgi:hypothetical protein